MWRSLLAGRADVCLLQRHLVSTLVTAEPLIRSPIVFDVDDAIHAGTRGWTADRIARRSALVICGNRFLADHYAGLAPVEIVPTGVDSTRFVPAQRRPDRPVIGWSGQSSGFSYLYEIEDDLAACLRRWPDAMLHIVADRPPEFTLMPRDRWRFVRWRPDVEVSALQEFSVGLMPLRDSVWERGKCSFKMLTYMSAGVPVVVSAVGMNVEVLAHGECGYGVSGVGEWVDAISTILSTPALAQRMGVRGREIVEQHYSSAVIVPRLAALLRAVAGDGRKVH